MRAFTGLAAFITFLAVWATVALGPIIVVGLIAWHFIAKFW